ncbi:FUSC family protein [Isoptericola cucumis]|uniref:FUSC family protein n=1 Tax=Isoptericola cucumis TaxID=1776856 RepID=UPI003208E9E7
MSGLRRLTARLRRVWLLHPRGAVAVRGAVAAALAWLVGMVAPPPFADYPYYAPLGAVIATTATLARSVRESVQAVAALLVGAGIAVGVDTVLPSDALSVALVVGVALLCAGWRGFGDQGAWVANSAIFVLVIGQGEGVEYVGAFAGLVLAGAAIGTGVNLLLPPLPLTPSGVALDRLRDALVEQLEDLAGRLEEHGPVDAQEWDRRRQSLYPTIERARSAVVRTSEASRGSLRARRHRDRRGAQSRRDEALGVAAQGVDEIVRLLVVWEDVEREHVALGPVLRPRLAAALRAFAAALRDMIAQDGGSPEDRSGRDAADDPTRRFVHEVEVLRDAVRAARDGSGDDDFVAGALVLVLRRSAHALAP